MKRKSVKLKMNAIFEGSIIEDYPEDARGHSCLMNYNTEDERPLHIVCAPKEDYLVIITAYIPDETKWAENFTRRINE
jgi:hypothetical protein